jgi:hypothetical protein
MLYVLSFGGDPITLETLSWKEAAQAETELDAWWRHHRSAGTILLGHG